MKPPRAAVLLCVATAAALLALPSTAPAVPPANDNFANAEAPSTLPPWTGTNVDATKEAGEPNHAGNAGGASVWYVSPPAPGGGTATLETCGSDFDTLLAVYTGNSVNALTEVASNNDSCGLQSQVTFQVTAGTTYYAAVDGVNGATGNITLNLYPGYPTPPVTSPDVDDDEGSSACERAKRKVKKAKRKLKEADSPQEKEEARKKLKKAKKRKREACGPG